MSWYKATLRESDGNIGATMMLLQQRFAQRMAAAAALQQPVYDMALLSAGDPLKGAIDVYFSPECFPHMQEMIDEVGAKKSEPPSSPDELVLQAGADDWRTRFF